MSKGIDFAGLLLNVQQSSTLIGMNQQMKSLEKSNRDQAAALAELQKTQQQLAKVSAASLKLR
jgi:hypothetical protein